MEKLKFGDVTAICIFSTGKIVSVIYMLPMWWGKGLRASDEFILLQT